MSINDSPAWIPRGIDFPALILVVAALAFMYTPVYLDLSNTVWKSDEQGHGPIIFAVSMWLLFNTRHKFAELVAKPALLPGYGLLILGSLLFTVGFSQSIWIFDMSAQILLLAGLALVFKGWVGLRLIWFPLLFLIFMVPLPEALVAAVTAPLKNAVSAVAGSLLYNLGYPVGRLGVLLTVGQYQLMVADACAGLNSMFTLEALGMLYMNLMKYTSVGRNVTLALVLVPIAFIANICRVMILVLVTYYFGDAAGQGFVHGFAGMVLFMVALIFMLLADKLLGFFFKADRS